MIYSRSGCEKEEKKIIFHRLVSIANNLTAIREWWLKEKHEEEKRNIFHSCKEKKSCKQQKKNSSSFPFAYFFHHSRLHFSRRKEKKKEEKKIHIWLMAWWSLLYYCIFQYVSHSNIQFTAQSYNVSYSKYESLVHIPFLMVLQQSIMKKKSKISATASFWLLVHWFTC